MSVFAFSLVLSAALLHAVWNALIKGAKDQALMLGVVNSGNMLFGLVLVLLFAPPLAEAWPFLILSTVIHLFYYGFLLLAYRHGDLSHVYPIARGVAPVLVAVGAYWFAGQTLSIPALAGIALVCTGIGLLVFGKKNISVNRAAVTAALGTGLVIAAYSVVDGMGVRVSQSALGYIGWLSLLEGVSVLLLFWYRKQALRTVTPRFVITGLAGGVVSSVAYGLAIYAMSLTQFAHVSAVRESSVIIAALIGVIWFGERPWKLRVIASVIVAAGVVLIAVKFPH